MLARSACYRSDSRSLSAVSQSPEHSIPLVFRFVAYLSFDQHTDREWTADDVGAGSAPPAPALGQVSGVNQGVQLLGEASLAGTLEETRNGGR